MDFAVTFNSAYNEAFMTSLIRAQKSQLVFWNNLVTSIDSDYIEARLVRT